MPEYKTKGQNSPLNLSIHINVNGLSFFIHEAKTKKAFKIHRKRFTEKVPVEKLHEKLHAELKAQNIIGQSFKEVRCSVENNLATLVPKALFEEKSLSEYVQKDIDIQNDDFVTFDNFNNTDWITVYVPFVNVNNMLIDTFGTFTYYHAVSVWLSALVEHSTADGELVWSMYKEQNHIHIALLRDKKLQFYNCFEAEKPKDIVYYVLLTAEKNNISSNEIPLFLVGDIIEKDHTYNALFSFIRSLNFLTHQSKVLLNTPMVNAHQDFCLLSLY